MLGVNYVLQSSRVQDVIYSEFKQWVKDGKVDAVEINVSTGQISFTVKNDNYKIYNTYPTETSVPSLRSIWKSTMCPSLQGDCRRQTTSS